LQAANQLSFFSSLRAALLPVFIPNKNINLSIKVTRYSAFSENRKADVAELITLCTLKQHSWDNRLALRQIQKRLKLKKRGIFGIVWHSQIKNMLGTAWERRETEEWLQIANHQQLTTTDFKPQSIVAHMRLIGKQKSLLY
jgi:hypothetical protein